MKVEIDGVVYEAKLVLSPTPPVDTSVEVPRDATTGPMFLAGPPKGFTLNGSVENFDLPLGPLTELPAPWYPKFSHNANSLNGDKEGQIYVTPAVKARGITYNPFSIVAVDGLKYLAITARPGTAQELPMMKEAGFQKTVLSGVASSSLEQIYGYYEAEHICPMFKGSWSGDWLMGPSWWPEFDIMEHLATPHGDRKWFNALHWYNLVTKGNKSAGGEATLFDPVTSRFKLGGLWHPNFCAVYFNGHKVWQRPNPPASDTEKGLHEPAHRVINLAVGGPGSDWATPVDHSQLPKSLLTRALGQWKSPY